jgi:hypothetical protein
MIKKITEDFIQRTSTVVATQKPVVQVFGRSGQSVISRLSQAFQVFNERSGSAIAVAWHPDDKCFVLKNSSSADKTSMQRVTESVEPDGWKPILAEKRNSSGDFIVQLESVESSERTDLDFAQHYAMTGQISGPKAVAGPPFQKALVAPASTSKEIMGPTSYGNARMRISPAIPMGVFQGEAGFANPTAAFINPGIARGILQGEVGFASADSQKHLIGSYGAGPCVIIALYHPASKRAALAHVDGNVDARGAIATLAYHLTAKSDSKSFNVHLASGTLGQGNEIERRLKQFLSYHRGAVICSEHNTSSLAIDAKDGSVYEGVKFGQLDDGEEVDARLKTRYQTIMSAMGRKERLIVLFEA